ncbi:MAG: ATP-binding protein [Chloroflexota bacterium]
MPNSNQPEKKPLDSSKRLVGNLVYSPVGRMIARLPFLSGAMRRFSRRLAQRQIPQDMSSIQRGPSTDLESSLRSIVCDVVEALGYVGAMVATYEPGDVLPVRALYIDPQIASSGHLQAWIEQVSPYSPQPLNLTDPKIARVFINDLEYQDNLSVQAAKSQLPVISDTLFDLLIPLISPAARPTLDAIQQSLGIQQVIALPFFIESRLETGIEKEYVGNLFAAKNGPISEADVRVLSAFARQMASAVLSERRRLRAKITQQLILDIHRALAHEDQILNRIAQGMVEELGYLGAMVAAYEPDDALPVRALYIDPQVASVDRLQAWIDEISAFSPYPLSLTDPNIARVYVHHPEHQGNLSTQAAREHKPVVSDSLFDLFTPIAPQAARSLIDGIQQALGIQQVIAAPFFSETFQDGQLHKEFVGNLFAATRARQFQTWEIELLSAFGEQAAAGLKNARLYRHSESRRVAAEIFGKMAFSATAGLHAFRNHVGYVRMSVHFLDHLRRQSTGLDGEVWDRQVPSMLDRLDQIKDILNSLHQPFRLIQNVPVKINTTLQRALMNIEAPEAWINLALAEDLPEINTVEEMLTAAFQVLIKNAIEAIQEKKEAGLPEDTNLPPLSITSRLTPEGDVEVTIYDRGIGIPPERLSKIYEIGYTTKQSGLGFGLFWTRDYLEGLGGSLLLESRWGEGTQVHIHLPALKNQPPGVSVPGA